MYHLTTRFIDFTIYVWLYYSRYASANHHCTVTVIMSTPPCSTTAIFKRSPGCRPMDAWDAMDWWINKLKNQWITKHELNSWWWQPWWHVQIPLLPLDPRHRSRGNASLHAWVRMIGMKDEGWMNVDVNGWWYEWTMVWMNDEQHEWWMMKA